MIVCAIDKVAPWGVPIVDLGFRRVGLFTCDRALDQTFFQGLDGNSYPCGLIATALKIESKVSLQLAKHSSVQMLRTPLYRQADI